MLKVIFDTNIYIDWLNAGHYEELLLERSFVRYMSTIVLMELRTGAFSKVSQKAIEDIHLTFSRTGRLIVPTATTFWDVGCLLQILQKDKGYDLKKCCHLVNDALIALSSRQIGATVITQNEDDFKQIQQIRGFKLMVVPPSSPA